MVPMPHVVAEIFHREKGDKCSGYVVTKHITESARAKKTRQLKKWFDLLRWPHTIRTKKDLYVR